MKHLDALKKVSQKTKEYVDENVKYTLPVATSDTLGGVKPVAKTEAMTQSVGVDELGRLFTEPSSGGNEEWTLINDITLAKDVCVIKISEDLNGNPFELNKVIVELTSFKQNSKWSPSGATAITFNELDKKYFSTNGSAYNSDSYLYCFPSKPSDITTDTYSGYLFAKWELEIFENGVILGKGRTGVLWEDADGVFYLPSGSTGFWVANRGNYFTGRLLTDVGIKTIGLRFYYDSLPAGTHIVIKGIRKNEVI